MGVSVSDKIFDCVVIEVTDPFYTSTRWRKLRKKILKRDKYMCQISKRYGKRVDAVTVHHIYPRSHYPQWQWCSWNLISVSKEAHNRLHDRLTDELTAEGEALKKRTPPSFQEYQIVPSHPVGSRFFQLGDFKGKGGQRNA